ncbi:MAG: hypothetical protein AB8I52_03655 [Candidatus Promineifilaceae bacterium]|jgi:tetratricopeptide (TPR) repeat protein
MDGAEWVLPFEQQMFDPRLMDKFMNDITRMLDDQEFESEEELNAFFQQFMESGQPIPHHKPETPLEKAQELVYEAWETENSSKRVRLARKALRTSPDCADAYLLLAEESANSPEEALELYEKAVQAGERALGPDAFSELEGHFWLATETRPYMRARLELAQLLWFLGESGKAIDELRDLLLLNPNDNQGVRYVLLPYLLQEGYEQEAADLLEQFKEDSSAAWAYTHALTLFMKHGPGRKANSNLKKALKANPHVPDFLLGRERVLRDLPPLMTLGDPLEAAYYYVDYLPYWLRVRGAIDWLRDFAPEAEE